MDLIDEQREILEPLVQDPPRRADGRGRPWRDPRDVLDGILWVLRTGAPRRDLPYRTCHRRFQRWNEEGALNEVLRALGEYLRDRGGLDLSECFTDGTFVGAKRGRISGKVGRGKGTKLMALADASGVPISIRAASASPHEVTLVEEVLAASFVRQRPKRLIGDRAYDSDPLDADLGKTGIEMLAPHCGNRTKPKTQDGRKLRRYKRRWKIERLFAWPGNFRRLVVRYERLAENYLGFVRLGCIIILLRYL